MSSLGRSSISKMNFREVKFKIVRKAATKKWLLRQTNASENIIKNVNIQRTHDQYSTYDRYVNVT